jgi:16S rRNA (adenine1518-N6/adenine1519-N6)-dimethyltransferase
VSNQHRPRKRFGQNFLRDTHVIDKILAAIAPRQDQHIVEIGPGEGALTRDLVKSGAQMTAVEIDKDLVPQLVQRFAGADNFSVTQADALTYDFRQLSVAGEKLRVVGNLPYNISTPLLFHLLQYADIIEDMHFMLQKEVVQRMAAGVGDGHYGRLSVMVQYACKVTPLLNVPPGAFFPAPKVDSAVLRLQPWPQLPHPAQDLRTLGNVVNIAFQQRRKTLRNALRTIISEDALTSLGIDSRLRPENLSLADFVAISNSVSNQKTEHHDPASAE